MKTTPIAVMFNNCGREKLREWGHGMAQYYSWDWHKLGHALEYYIDSIKCDPRLQHPWTNLAYVFHLMGDESSARNCLKKSMELAEDGPDSPGHNYKRIEAAIDDEKFLSGEPVVREAIPEWFIGKYRRLLNII